MKLILSRFRKCFIKREKLLLDISISYKAKRIKIRTKMKMMQKIQSIKDITKLKKEKLSELLIVKN